MGGPAVKDQGIDVVAVGNGGGAQRKNSDLRTDLVLAHVFMTVLAGYEDMQSFVDYVPARPARVRIDTGSQPVAFGSLLETSADEKVDDLDFLPPRNSELVPDRDWRDPDTNETDEEVEEEKPPAPWRREEAESNADAGSASPAKDWRACSFDQILARKAHGQSSQPVEEKQESLDAPVVSNLKTEALPALASTPDPTTLTTTIPSIPFATEAWPAGGSTA